jgi:uncharacterized protein DUF4350
MPLARSRELILPIGAIALVAVLTAIGALLSPPGASGLPPGSSFSKDPDGSAAAYLTLQALGYDIRRSFEPLPSLALTPAATVLVLADPREPASEQDRRMIQSFIAAGGTLLVTGCEAAAFLGAANRIVEPIRKERTFRAEFPSPLAAGVPRIAMTSFCGSPQPGSPFLSIYSDGQASVVKAARIGAGTAIWWAANSPIGNESIDAEGHLELLLNAVGPRTRTIVWDEFHHGQRRSLWSYSRQTPLPWLLAQLGIVAIAAAAMFVRRRLPVRPEYVESRTSPLEFVETMAGLYARAGSAHDAAIVARSRLRRLLLDATGLGANVDDERLAAAAAVRFRLDRGELARALEPGEDARIEAQALPLVCRLQELSAVVNRTGG